MKNLLFKSAQGAAMPAVIPVVMPAQTTSEAIVEKPRVRTALVLMASFHSTVFDEMHKSLGNVTTCKHKGQNIIKKKVKKVNDPKTPEQQKQRSKFPSLVELSALFAPAIGIGLKHAKETKHTEANFFVHVNKGVVTVDDGMVKNIDFEHLVLSKGNRMVPDEASAVLEKESREVTLTFEAEDEDEFVPHAEDDDVFYCCLVEKTLLKLKMVRMGTRSELSGTPYTLTLPRKWTAETDNIAVYLFCTDKKQTVASKTVYLPLE